MKTTFKAFVVKKESNKFVRTIETKFLEELPHGDVLIRVHYSSLNYKDGLSCIGNVGVTRKYPHIPGIDASGVVVSSNGINFKEGDNVFVIGTELGMNHWGGFSQYIRVPESWVTLLPEDLTLKDAMIFGTAGLTAALAVYELINQKITIDLSPILVTGSTGGIGTFSVGILSKLGYNVTASTGKKTSNDFLMNLGVNNVIDRLEVDDKTGMILLKQKWAACIDTVGGNILSTILRSSKDKAIIVSTGMVSSQNFNLTVMPFILRGIKLVGINTQSTSFEVRNQIWKLLANSWKPINFEQIYTECNLEELDSFIDEILSGEIIGRIIVNLK